jgi:hypothetical protein
LGPAVPSDLSRPGRYLPVPVVRLVRPAPAVRLALRHPPRLDLAVRQARARLLRLAPEVRPAPPVLSLQPVPATPVARWALGRPMRR